MSGLYRRALEIYHVDSNHSVEPWNSEPTELSEIPTSEREAVLRQIDDIIESNRLRVDSEELKRAARSRGALLPVAANLVIIAVAAALLVFFSLRLNRQEQQLQAGQGTIQTAESQVVQAVREQFAEQVKQKDTEIQSIQDRLQKASLERDSIRSEAQSTIQKREQQFADQLQTALAAERTRLVQNGLAAPEVESRLSSYRQQLTADYQNQLQAFRAETEARAAEREKSVNNLISTYQLSLQKSQEERVQLEKDFAAREAELTQKADLQTRELRQSQSQTQAELQKLQSQAAQDHLLSSQILDSYAKVKSELGIPDYPAALDTLAALRESFDREPAVSSQTVQERRPVDMFIISSLEDLINTRRAQPAEKPTVDELKTAQAAAGKLIADGRTSYSGNNWQQTLDEYQGALELLLPDRQTAARLVAQVASAGYQIGAARDKARTRNAESALSRQEKLLENLKQLRDWVDSLPVGGASPDMTGEETASLLQAKLLVWQIISTDPVRTRYPKLYDTMQRYFDAFAAEQQREGRKAALDSVLTMLSAVGAKSPSKITSEAATTDDRTALLQILDRISALVR